MDRKKVVSSNINSIGYDETKKLLEIEFYSQDVYQYHPVEKEVYNRIMNAESIGKQYFIDIKNNKTIAFKKID